MNAAAERQQAQGGKYQLFGPWLSVEPRCEAGRNRALWVLCSLLAASGCTEPVPFDGTDASVRDANVQYDTSPPPDARAADVGPDGSVADGSSNDGAIDGTVDGGRDSGQSDAAPRRDSGQDGTSDTNASDATADSEQPERCITMGTAVTARAFNGKAPADAAEEYQKRLKELFKYGVMENMGKMWVMHQSRSDYFWNDIDATLSWFEENGLKLKYHTLVNASPHKLPAWYTDLPTTADRRSALEEHVRTIVRRYRGRIGIYDVVNHPLMYGDRQDYMQTGWTLQEAVVKTFTWAREEDPQATLLINEGYPIIDPEEREAYIAMVRGAISDGAPIDGIGFMGHLGSKLPDDEAIEQFINDLASAGIPVHITEFDLDPPEDPELPFDDYDSWWSYQAYAYRHFFEIVNARQDVEGLFMWGFYDGAHWKPGAGLFDVNFDPKPVYHTLEPLLTGRSMPLPCQ